MENASESEFDLIASYMAEVFNCVSQLSKEKKGLPCSKDHFQAVKEHPIHQHPELLEQANELLAPTLDHHRGHEVLNRIYQK